MYRKPFSGSALTLLIAAAALAVAQPPTPPAGGGGSPAPQPPGRASTAGRPARSQFRPAAPNTTTQPPRPNPVPPSSHPARPPTPSPGGMHSGDLVSAPPGSEAPPQLATARAEPPTPPASDEGAPPDVEPEDPILGPRSAVPPLVALDIEVAGENWGRIVVELNEEKAPLTVTNFLRYVDDGFYNGTIFHRIIPDFLVQGGGYTAIEQPKTEGLRRPIRSEARNGLKNLRATVGLARARNPHTGAAQFYFNLADNPRLDYPSRDGWGYTVFGKVTEGWDIVERMAGLERQRDQTGKPVDTTPSEPLSPPRIVQAVRLNAPTAAPSEPPGVEPAPPAKPPTTRPRPPRDQPEPSPDDPPPT